MLSQAKVSHAELLNRFLKYDFFPFHDFMLDMK